MEDFDINIDPQDEELIVDIDTDGLSAEAINIATSLVSNLSTIYFDDEFMSKHPKLKKRIDIEIESLRVLIKMRKTNEQVHDVLIKAIQANPNNASLYRALTQIQSTLLDIQKQMDTTISGLNTLLKGYQMELEFKEEEKETADEELNDDTVHRGSKEFIQNIQNMIQEETKKEDN